MIIKHIKFWKTQLKRKGDCGVFCLFGISKSHDHMGSFCWRNCGTCNCRRGKLKYRSGITMERTDQSAILWGQLHLQIIWICFGSFGFCELGLDAWLRSCIIGLIQLLLVVLLESQVHCMSTYVRRDGTLMVVRVFNF